MNNTNSLHSNYLLLVYTHQEVRQSISSCFVFTRWKYRYDNLIYENKKRVLSVHYLAKSKYRISSCLNTSEAETSLISTALSTNLY